MGTSSRNKFVTPTFRGPRGGETSKIWFAYGEKKIVFSTVKTVKPNS